MAEYLLREEKRDFSLSVSSVGRPLRLVQEHPNVRINVLRDRLYRDIQRQKPELAEKIRPRWSKMTIAELQELLLSPK
ncbi:MAG: hypothetical protein UX00_C0004G0029 [Microgenomates group bacterium GW2011_GWB1_45_17]|nr:MAG: hypothetical protein UX00_C0004G0029 [Microgenomates group bacterium GW2011_GWB1_45_17]